MSEETKNTQQEQEAVESKETKKEPAKPAAKSPRLRRGQSRLRRRQKRVRQERKPEFEQKILSIRRVVRVMAGGRRFSFSVAMVAGDRKGRVGVGVGKAGDTALAIQKALRDAQKNMITVARTETGSIPFDVTAKYDASTVAIRPAKGRGLVAGAAMRTVLDLAGVTDVTAKVMTRSKNDINIARATIEALKKLNS